MPSSGRPGQGEDEVEEAPQRRRSPRRESAAEWDKFETLEPPSDDAQDADEINLMDEMLREDQTMEQVIESMEGATWYNEASDSSEDELSDSLGWSMDSPEEDEEESD